jgi:hypothetical protein
MQLAHSLVREILLWFFDCHLEMHKCSMCEDFNRIAERQGVSQAIGEGLLNQGKALFELWYQVRDGTLSRPAIAERVHPLRAALKTLIEEGARVFLNDSTGTITIETKNGHRLSFSDSRGQIAGRPRNFPQRCHAGAQHPIYR